MKGGPRAYQRPEATTDVTPELRPPTTARSAWYKRRWWMPGLLLVPPAGFGTIGYLQGFWPGGLIAGLITGVSGATGAFLAGLVRRHDRRVES